MKTISRREKKTEFFITVIIVIITLLAATAFAQSEDITLSAIETPHTEHGATQMPAEVGKPVQWVKEVEVQNLYDQATSELTVNIPQDAEKITVTDKQDNSNVETTVNESELTITDSLAFNEQKEYMIRYETEAPKVQESTLVRDGDKLVKNVVVSSNYHYQDVLTYTDIPETGMDNVQQKVRLYWDINGVKTDVTSDPELELSFYDTNNNGMYDRIGWITPHLSTQIFEVVVYSDADPGAYPNIRLNLLYPSNGEYIASTSKVNFNYIVSYNASTTVFCNLSVDGIVKRENIPTTADTEITTYFNLSSGMHNWNVNCAGNDGAENTSETRTFTIDLDTPTVALNTPDYHVSYTNGIQLNFTPLDEKYSTLICALSVNRELNRTGIVAINSTRETVQLTGLSNGVYNWNVSCMDAAGNTGRSEERVFYISLGTPSEYNVSPNKQSYAIGEVGYLLITAASGSNVTLFIDPPSHDSFFINYYGRSFPLIDMMNFTNNAGSYNIDAIFTHSGNLYITRTSFTASSNFDAKIDTNETAGRPGDAFKFEANATGGIGAVTYAWDFGDDTTASGAKTNHSYSQTGDYTVEMTATDAKGNKATETVRITVRQIHTLSIIVKELQTQKVLAGVPVEVDDERKSTDAAGQTSFTVYDGKRRIYVAMDGYDWVKQVRNITEDTTITIELNNTAITNYTPMDITEQQAAEQVEEKEDGAKNQAERMLADINTALESIKPDDVESKDIIDALGVESKLQQAAKELRQIIRDLDVTDTIRRMTQEERTERIKNITGNIKSFEGVITSVEVLDTTEFEDHAKAADIKMLSEEYLRYRKAEYSKSEKEDYISENTKLQEETSITTRLAIVELGKLSGIKTTAAVVVNKVSKLPANKAETAIIEYLPKEVAANAGEIEELTDFETVKYDPILKFSAGLETYSYYLEKELTLDPLKKTKHVILKEPVKKSKGLGTVTGFSIFPNINIDDPKLFAEIVIIAILLLAYLAYHFEIIDRIKEMREQSAKKSVAQADVATYKPESAFDTITRKAKALVDNEENRLMDEVAHIKSLIISTHRHIDASNHAKAEEVYGHVSGAYSLLSKEAKEHIHPETKNVYNKLLLAKTNELLNKAFLEIECREHAKAATSYSEIKSLYSQLENEHRAAVSDRCIKLHEKLFESTLT